MVQCVGFLSFLLPLMFFGLKKTTITSGYIQRLVGDKILYYVLINIISELTFITLSYEIRSQNYIVKYIKETILYDRMSYIKLHESLNCLIKYILKEF